MPRKLKLFRTAIGFHDAYVAAPSRKAALEAWGAEGDLFQQKLAEEVGDDAAMLAQASGRPGEVIRKLRGSAAEHVEALGKTPRPGGKAAPGKPGAGRAGGARAARPAPKPRAAKPSRAALDKAERALARAEAAHRDELETLRAEQDALDARRRALERRFDERRAGLAQSLDEARRAYRSKLADWGE